jgi:hypothetical protein
MVFAIHTVLIQGSKRNRFSMNINIESKINEGALLKFNSLWILSNKNVPYFKRKN